MHVYKTMCVYMCIDISAKRAIYIRKRPVYICTRDSVLQRVAVFCSRVLQCVAVCCEAKKPYTYAQETVYCSVLQCVAVC